MWSRMQSSSVHHGHIRVPGRAKPALTFIIQWFPFLTFGSVTFAVWFVHPGGGKVGKNPRWSGLHLWHHFRLRIWSKGSQGCKDYLFFLHALTFLSVLYTVLTFHDQKLFQNILTPLIPVMNLCSSLILSQESAEIIFLIVMDAPKFVWYSNSKTVHQGMLVYCKRDWSVPWKN